MSTAPTATGGFIDLHPEPADMARLVAAGLAQQPKQLPAWFLYDAEGSRLFEAICRQPEYSLTRTETALLEAQAPALAAALGPGVLVEFGTGSARKVDPLLAAMAPRAYLALDISAEPLAQACQQVQRRHPGLAVFGLCCDYSRLEQLPELPVLRGEPLVGFYPGSSLGNFDPPEAAALLRRFRQLLGAQGRLLIGIDQPKAVERLEAAYNDAAGLSAAFALNLLQRLNRDLDGSFDLSGFRYRARWQPQESRIEMALVSGRRQEVALAGRRWTFAAGEPLISEYSYKYIPAAFCALAETAGWRCQQRWCDPADDLSLHLLVPRPEAAADSRLSGA